MWSSIFAKGIYVAAFSMLFIVFLNPSIPGTMFYQNEPAFLTAFFSLFVFFNLFNALNSREEGLNIFSNITKNKGFMTVFCVIFIVQLLLIFFGGKVFRTTPLPWQQIILLLAMAATIIPFDLIRKGIRNAVTA
jgi:magnesium-transporting ATPase (P-type)